MNVDEDLNNEDHKPKNAYTLTHKIMNSLSTKHKLNECYKKIPRNSYKNLECMNSLSTTCRLSEFMFPKPIMYELAKRGDPA